MRTQRCADRQASDRKENQIRRTVVSAATKPGGGYSSGRFQNVTAADRGGRVTGSSSETTNHCVDSAVACVVSCGRSCRTCTRQHPILAISPHCPCIARQQALSSWLMAAEPVMQANTGAAALNSRNKATILAKRRMTLKVYRAGGRQDISTTAQSDQWNRAVSCKRDGTKPCGDSWKGSVNPTHESL